MKYAQCDIACRDCNIGVVAAADAPACMAACNSTAACVAFVAVPLPSSGVNCTLKSVAGPGSLPLLPLTTKHYTCSPLHIRFRQLWPRRRVRACVGHALIRLEWNVRARTCATAAASLYARAATTMLRQCAQDRLAGCVLSMWTLGGQTKPKTALSCSPTAKSWCIRRRREETTATTPVRRCCCSCCNHALTRAPVAVPYLPIVIAGFDPRPWEEPAPSFAHPSQEEWLQALAQARDFVEAEDNRKFGFPDATSVTGVQPAVIIYAWNEFGEGGILAPTAGWGDMMVTTVGEVFARRGREWGEGGR
jgi:hypothetical protein